MSKWNYAHTDIKFIDENVVDHLESAHPWFQLSISVSNAYKLRWDYISPRAKTPSSPRPRRYPGSLGDGKESAIVGSARHASCPTVRRCQPRTLSTPQSHCPRKGICPSRSIEGKLQRQLRSSAPQVVVGGCAGSAGAMPGQEARLYRAARRDQTQCPLQALALGVYTFR